ncbi:hypothetical protein GNE08_06555 [Trichormus variabilis ARAD]|nr:MULTISPECIES: hypothetical protein [Nostocaceae]MBC1213881.1 hypothetical protein [Trichormus variabilis ARAD]MBC1255496.1 hypothetical protein [Trichormus variabilis V5]MBC1266019.1 hypothetical protein [Trichormus variabilis FSR]MBC1302031.1 hypothetical protein [Trichormus variabilis N2B]MBC1310877.1 hypothetical protein [Trichormus variabilis PNB]
MLNNISKSSPLRQLRIPAIGLLFTLSVVGAEIKPVQSREVSSLTSITLSTYGQPHSSLTPTLMSFSPVSEDLAQTKNQKAEKETAIAPKFSLPKKDGIYLYGQSPQPDQIGQGYVLFKKQQGRLVGALYMPNSEFSCFQGKLDTSGELAMTVTATPDAGISPEVATASTLPKFSEDEPTSYAYSLALQDYHPINRISPGDRRILQMCSQ